MYYILVYDVNEKRVAKALKTCRKYLHHIQNSVFEGELTPGQFDKLKADLSKVINFQEDSVIVFKSSAQKWLEKEIVGIEKRSTDNFL